MKLRLITVMTIATIFLSCSKGSDSSSAPIYYQSFKWTFGSTSYVADSSIAYLNGSGKRTIVAWNKGAVVGTFKIGFAITSFNLGGNNITTTIPGPNPPLPTAMTNNLYYFDDNGNELLVTNGAINILAYANGRVSGNFTANLLDANGAGRFLVGSFTDVPVKP